MSQGIVHRYIYIYIHLHCHRITRISAMALAPTLTLNPSLKHYLPVEILLGNDGTNYSPSTLTKENTVKEFLYYSEHQLSSSTFFLRISVNCYVSYK